MPKMKSRSSIAKRFKKTASGGLKRNRQHTRHKLGKMDANRKRRLRKAKMVSNGDQKRIIDGIPY
ncbi:MAG: 50S ribosomal protein L35 [Tissierellia bacterium]|nr:50S ribosomal protein L35 [Tissierellia bacterium]